MLLKPAPPAGNALVCQPRYQKREHLLSVSHTCCPQVLVSNLFNLRGGRRPVGLWHFWQCWAHSTWESYKVCTLVGRCCWPQEQLLCSKRDPEASGKGVRADCGAEPKARNRGLKKQFALPRFLQTPATGSRQPERRLRFTLGVGLLPGPGC